MSEKQWEITDQEDINLCRKSILNETFSGIILSETAKLKGLWTD